MEKRAILALVLSLVVLIGFPYLFLGEKKSADKGADTTVSPQKSDELASPPKAIPQVSDLQLPEAGAPVTGQEEIITVESPAYIIKLSNRGGVVTYWELKGFKDEKRKKNIILFDQKNSLTSIPPLSITTAEANASAFLSSGIYQFSGPARRVLDTDHPKTSVTLSLYDPAAKRGLSKTLSFDYKSYVMDIQVTPVGFSEPLKLTGGSDLGIQSWGELNVIGYVGPATQAGEDVVKDKPDKLKKEVFHQEPIGWTALHDKYFIGALIPRSPTNGAFIQKVKEKEIQVGLKLPYDRTSTVSFYAGPKEYEQLNSLRVGLDRTIEFGWFMFGDWVVIRWLAKTLFHGLQFLHTFTGNYGLSIILLTVIIKVSFIPLTHKSYKSMKEMQNIQPEIQKLQKKYKEDKQKLNKELLEVYRTHRVNPLGGCLPMVLQVPVFIGLFNLLYSTIELRQAPFFLWVHDLSSKDPYYVLPIIMGITMFIQQKMTPTAMDPRQAKIMLALPIIFTFFFLSFASGLVLYWLVNNVLTITQQYITMKYLYPTPVPAKRSGKK